VSADDLAVNTRLALDRTRLACERTLMAWVRTAISLISFGFTIHKFFEFERDAQVRAEEGVLGPRTFALLMIGIGLTALILATVDHRRSLQTLGAGDHSPSYSLALFTAGLVGVLGVLGFTSVLMRL
jgi:putative membrane protein